ERLVRMREAISDLLTPWAFIASMSCQAITRFSATAEQSSSSPSSRRNCSKSEPICGLLAIAHPSGRPCALCTLLGTFATPAHGNPEASHEPRLAPGLCIQRSWRGAPRSGSTTPGGLQPQEPRRVVVEDRPLLLRGQERGAVHALDRERDRLGPDHLVGTEHQAVAE